VLFLCGKCPGEGEGRGGGGGGVSWIRGTFEERETERRQNSKEFAQEFFSVLF
jgi:hypothetical protein